MIVLCAASTPGAAQSATMDIDAAFGADIFSRCPATRAATDFDFRPDMGTLLLRGGGSRRCHARPHGCRLVRQMTEAGSCELRTTGGTGTRTGTRCSFPVRVQLSGTSREGPLSAHKV